jgi:hypothetical protein
MRHFRIAVKFSALALAAFSAATSPAGAVVYDALNDYSTVNNPNGPWSYGEGQIGTSFSLFPTFQLVDPVNIPNIYGWDISQGHPPLVAINSSGSLQFFGDPTSSFAIIPTNALFVHPGNPSDDVIVAWTAPSAGIYDLSGFFEILHSMPSGIIGQVYDGSTELYSHYLRYPAATPSAPGATAHFNIVDLNLAAGDTLYFGVNDAGTALNDWTGFDVTITEGYVPPPPSVPRALDVDDHADRFRGARLHWLSEGWQGCRRLVEGVNRTRSLAQKVAFGRFSASPGLRMT